MTANPYEAPRNHPDVQRRSVGIAVRALLILLAVGFAVVFIGFWYDVRYAGIPYQDPTPAMQASYDFHQQLASLIRLIGEVLFVVALATLITVGLVKLARPR